MRKSRGPNKSIRKGSISQSYVDQDIWLIHKAIAEKICAQPALIEHVNQTLNQRFENGILGYSAWLTWQCILQLINDKEAFIQAILADTEQMRKNRRCTPLVGILTEQERQQAVRYDNK